MTLTKKISLGVLASLVAIFMATYTITLFNNRNFFMQQMNSNAQDTATSLGLSLSHAVSIRDKATILSMVQAVFDRGYFSKIEIRDAEQKIIVSRYLEKQTGSVPAWFTHIISLPVQLQSSVIMQGWLQVGTVSVAPDSGYAYEAIWQSACYWILIYILFALIAVSLVFLLIHWLMAPLKKVVLQAEAICKRRYPIEILIPKTSELRQVTLAMNQMVRHIKELFEDQVTQIDLLQKKSFQDSLTQLGNRRFFLQQWVHLLNHKDDYQPGFVILIALDGLEELNKTKGYAFGDKALIILSKACTNFWSGQPGVDIARMNGSNFALLIRTEQEQAFIDKCNKFNQLLRSLPYVEWGCTTAMAVHAYQFHDLSFDLLKALDKLLIKARKAKDSIAFSDQMPKAEMLSITEALIKNALAEKKYTLYGQFVGCKDAHYHQELFMCLVVDEQEIRAARFMPLADKWGFSATVDQLMLDRVIAEKLLEQGAVALNLSTMTILNSDSSAYIKKLRALPEKQRKNLFLEVSETILFEHLEAVQTFANILHDLSIRFGVDQVGIHFKSELYLKELPIHYLKLHASLLEDIHENLNKQFLLHYFNKLSKILSIDLIVTRIESEEEWILVQDLGFKLGQGAYLDKDHLV